MKDVEKIDKLFGVVCELQNENRYADLYYFLDGLPDNLKDDLHEYMSLINEHINETIVVENA